MVRDSKIGGRSLKWMGDGALHGEANHTDVCGLQISMRLNVASPSTFAD